MSNASRAQYSANPHFLNTLSGLLARQAIVVGHAVTAPDGSILLTSGSQLQARHFQLLPQQLLRSPLESSLVLPDFAAHRLLREKSNQLLASQPLLPQLLEKTAHRHACLSVLENLPLNHALTVLLAMLEEQQLLEHSLLCCLISLGLALRTGQSSTLLEQIALAALFHDIGELYLDAGQAATSNRAGPLPWRQRMVHPLIAYRQMLQLGQHQQLEAIALAILQHHERLDGSGYPRREKEKQLGIAGQLIAVADLSCRLLQKNHPCQRLDIALRIIPGEFHRPAVGVMNCVLKQLDKGALATPTPPQAMEALHALLKRIGEITHLLLNLQEETLTAAGQTALSRCMDQFDTIQRSLFSTGMQTSPPLGQEEDLQLEILLVVEEINWRLRNLGRDLNLVQDKLGPDDVMLFQPLSSVLLASLPA
jgi:hypothetical protein